MVDIKNLKLLIYQHVRDMGYSSLNLKINAFNPSNTHKVELEGQFDEFMGDTIVFKAVYNQHNNELISFNIITKKPRSLI